MGKNKTSQEGEIFLEKGKRGRNFLKKGHVWGGGGIFLKQGT